MDPSILFTASVILVPLVYCPDLPAAIAYLTQPSLLASFVLVAAIIGATRAGPCVALAPRESRLAFWFLANGVYFNLFLDVVAGQFQLMGEMSKQYNFVEPRYALGYLSDAGAPVFMTSMLELFCHSPLGVLTFVAYSRGWPQRHLAAFAVSMLHVIGVMYFYVPEVLNGFRHLGGWPASLEEGLSFHRLLFFWFGFWFCGTLWVVIPLLIIRHTWGEICAAVAVADGPRAKRA